MGRPAPHPPDLTLRPRLPRKAADDADPLRRELNGPFVLARYFVYPGR